MRFRNNKYAAALAFWGLIALAVSFFLPVIKISQFGQISERTVPQGIAILFADGAWLLGLIMVAFSMIFPIAKLTLLLTAVTNFVPMTVAQRQRVIHLVHKTSKLSHLEIFFAAMLIMFVKLDDIVDFHVGAGVYCFMIALTCSWLGSIAAHLPKS